MTPTRRSFFASLAAIAVVPKLVKAEAPAASALRWLADHEPLTASAAYVRLDDHEAHLRMHLEGLRTGYEPMTPWAKAREYAWRRHIRQHQLEVDRIANRWTL